MYLFKHSLLIIYESLKFNLFPKSNNTMMFVSSNIKNENKSTWTQAHLAFWHIFYN